MSEGAEESQATGNCRSCIICIECACNPTLVSNYNVKGNVKEFLYAF